MHSSGRLTWINDLHPLFFIANRLESRPALESVREFKRIRMFFLLNSLNRANLCPMKPSDQSTTLSARRRPFRIIFVCLGNICRSPAAQGVMESLIRDSSLQTQIDVDSAGTASYHIGRLPDNRMLAAAARRGYQLKSLAKALTNKHVWDRQLVFAMDRENGSIPFYG